MRHIQVVYTRKQLASAIATAEPGVAIQVGREFYLADLKYDKSIMESIEDLAPPGIRGVCVTGSRVYAEQWPKLMNRFQPIHVAYLKFQVEDGLVYVAPYGTA